MRILLLLLLLPLQATCSNVNIGSPTINVLSCRFGLCTFETTWPVQNSGSPYSIDYGIFDWQEPGSPISASINGDELNGMPDQPWTAYPGFGGATIPTGNSNITLTLTSRDNPNEFSFTLFSGGIGGCEIPSNPPLDPTPEPIPTFWDSPFDYIITTTEQFLTQTDDNRIAGLQGSIWLTIAAITLGVPAILWLIRNIKKARNNG